MLGKTKGATMRLKAHPFECGGSCGDRRRAGDGRRARPDAAKTQPAAKCGPDGTTQFICGLSAPEDLIRVSGTNWVLASGMADAASHEALYAIDSKTHSFDVVFPVSGAKMNHDKKRYGECPGPLPGTARPAARHKRWANCLTGEACMVATNQIVRAKCVRQ